MKIGYVSDLHLDSSNIKKIDNPGWDVLVIAGDLAVDFNLIEDFFHKNSDLEIPIIYVLGNHEYDDKTFSTVAKDIKKLLSFNKNIHVLDNESIVINNTKFIGSTLWTDFNNQSAVSMDVCNTYINFFSVVFQDDGEFMTPRLLLKEHKKAVEFIKYELKYKEDNVDSVVVVTHFAPSKKSLDKKYSHRESSFWASDLECLLGFSDLWIHGHIHSNNNYNIEGTTILSNARGYSKTYNLSENVKFDINQIEELNKKVLKNKM